MEENRFLSIAILPEKNNGNLRNSDINNVNTTIINKRMFIKYNNNGILENHSCFIYLLKKEPLKIGDYFLSYNKLERVSKIIEDSVEIKEYIGDNEINYLIPLRECIKVVGSTDCRIEKELSIKIDFTFVNTIVINYQKSKKLPLRCKIGIGKNKVNDKTILCYKQEINNNTLLQLFKNIVSDCVNNNRTYIFRIFVSMWKKRVLKKGLEEQEFNSLLKEHNEELETYYNSLIFKQ